MIPGKLIKTAEAEYFCNVSEFIGLGEGGELTTRELCSIKMQYPGVEDWLRHLSPTRRLQVMDYVQKEYERSRNPLY